MTGHLLPLERIGLNSRLQQQTRHSTRHRSCKKRAAADGGKC